MYSQEKLANRTVDVHIVSALGLLKNDFNNPGTSVDTVIKRPLWISNNVVFLVRYNSYLILHRFRYRLMYERRRMEDGFIGYYIIEGKVKGIQ